MATNFAARATYSRSAQWAALLPAVFGSGRFILLPTPRGDTHAPTFLPLQSFIFEKFYKQLIHKIY